MKISKYGFIVMAPGYSSKEQRTVIDNEIFRTEIVGVETIEGAISAARDLIDNGIQLVELCGGFGHEGANQVIDRLETDVPIGFVGFTAKENDKLSKLLTTK